jgi:acyl-[acyl-carrier-protein] desaturase
MVDFLHRNRCELEEAMWRLYRHFFDQAERRRRWNLEKDIPWAQCNKALDPVIADVVESFCVVELYLPDYLANALPRSRASRARTWFYTNWGYEESKHSLALGDWLVRSGHRTDEQLADLEGEVLRHDWRLPQDNHVAMFAYTMVQEQATGLNYRNLRRKALESGGDPALEKLLMLVAVDEQSHYSFFRDCLRLYLEHDREGTLEQLRRVMNNFSMPAIQELADGRQRVARIRELEIFNEDVYFRDVYLPVLHDIGVQRSEMRNRLPRKKSAPTEQPATSRGYAPVTLHPAHLSGSPPRRDVDLQPIDDSSIPVPGV